MQIKNGETRVTYPKDVVLTLRRRKGRRVESTTITLDELIREYSLISLFNDKIFNKEEENESKTTY
jgi:hypothetical protein